MDEVCNEKVSRVGGGVQGAELEGGEEQRGDECASCRDCRK